MRIKATWVGGGAIACIRNNNKKPQTEKMKTIELTVYRFSELSEKAKERAKERYAEVFGYNWSDDALESLIALTEHFDGSVRDYSIDWFDCSPSNAKFDMPELEPEEIKSRLDSLGSYDPKTLRGHGDCKLTGFCADENAIDGFRKAWHGGERNLEKLMQAAFKTWIKFAQEDCNSQYSDEQFSETADANDWNYYEDGELA